MNSEGPPRVYVPILRVPWMFRYLPGVAGYKLEEAGDMRPLCLVTGNRIGRDLNTGKAAEVKEK